MDVYQKINLVKFSLRDCVDKVSKFNMCFHDNFNVKIHVIKHSL